MDIIPAKTGSLLSKKIVKFLFYSCLVSSFSVVAAPIAVVTNKTIEGYAPKIKEAAANEIAKNIGFKIDGVNYTDSDIRNGSIYLSAHHSFNQIQFYSDLSSFNNNHIDDSDGDTLSSDGISADLISLSIESNSGENIPTSSTDLLNPALCLSTSTSPYKGPFTLKIMARVKYKTEFGNPNQGDVTNVGNNGFIQKIYKLEANDGFCFLKPLNENKPSHAANVGKLFSSDYAVKNGVMLGFKAMGHKPFPTTAFKEAKFKVVLKQPISNYTLSLVGETKGFKIESATGLATFTDKPAQNRDYTIKAVNKNTMATFYYSFRFKERSWFRPIPSKLFMGGLPTDQGFIDVVEACHGIENIPALSELTNSVFVTDKSYYTISEGVYKLKDHVDHNTFTWQIGTLFSEWGKLQDTEYRATDWVTWYFTKDVHPAGRVFTLTETDKMTKEMSGVAPKDYIYFRYGIGSWEGNLTVIKRVLAYGALCVE